MRVAISIRNDRISPVFDAATRLMLVDVEDGVEQERCDAIMEESSLAQRGRRLVEFGVNVLICGAISRPLAATLAAAGIAVIPWTAGPVDEVLAAYLKGRLPDPRWLMPGCGAGRERHRGGRGWCTRKA